MASTLRRHLARAAGIALVDFTRVLVGARGRWREGEPATAQRLYFANHSSHLDTLALWSALPAAQRARTRPVAARDYWNGDPLRRFIARDVLDAVLIERRREHRAGDPLVPVFAALDTGASLILFPEGTRTPERLPQAFRGGLFRIAEAWPALQLLPVYLDTLHRSLPKGSLLPLPLDCTVHIGAPLPRVAGEPRDAFLERARAAVVALAPATEPTPP